MALVKQTSTISASAIFYRCFYGSTWGINGYHTFHQPRLIPVKLRIVHLILKLLRITAQIQELPVIMSVFCTWTYLQLPSVTAQKPSDSLKVYAGYSVLSLQRPAVTHNRLRAPGRQARREDIRQIDHPLQTAGSLCPGKRTSRGIRHTSSYAQSCFPRHHGFPAFLHDRR